jgi:6-phosphogluconate dehydrogenase (decarboxylating)
MQLGMVGLGRMGANMARRLLRAGHGVAAYDRDPAPGRALESEGAVAATSLDHHRAAAGSSLRTEPGGSSEQPV